MLLFLRTKCINGRLLVFSWLAFVVIHYGMLVIFILCAFALQAGYMLTGVSLGPCGVAERAEGQRCSFS